MKKINDKGFSLIEGLLIFVIIAIIGGTIFYVYNANKKISDGSDGTTISGSSQSNEEKKPASLTEKFVSPLNNFSIMYPADWKAKSKTEKQGEDDIIKASLTSPSGTVLHINSDYGGYGGGCNPDKNDEPFQAGNNCSSWEYLSKDVVPSIDNNYYAKDVTTGDEYKSEYEKVDVAIVTLKIASPDEKPKYIIGLEEDNPQYPIQVNKPEMGLNYNFTSLSVYDAEGNFKPDIYAYAIGEDKSFLSSKDAETIRLILQTLVLNN